MKVRKVVELSVEEARKYVVEYLVNFYINDSELLTELVNHMGIKPIDKESDESIIDKFAEFLLADKVIKYNSLDPDTLVVIRKSEDQRKVESFELVDVSTEVDIFTSNKGE